MIIWFIIHIHTINEKTKYYTDRLTTILQFCEVIMFMEASDFLLSDSIPPTNWLF